MIHYFEAMTMVMMNYCFGINSHYHQCNNNNNVFLSLETWWWWLWWHGDDELISLRRAFCITTSPIRRQHKLLEILTGKTQIMLMQRSNKPCLVILNAKIRLNIFHFCKVLWNMMITIINKQIIKTRLKIVQLLLNKNNNNKININK